MARGVLRRPRRHRSEGQGRLHRRHRSQHLRGALRGHLLAPAGCPGETRSGRSVDLLKTDASQWQAKDHTGRTAVFDLDPSGNLAKTTDTEGKPTAFGHDSSGRINKITTAEGRVTAFTYDDANRVTSMLRATEFNGSVHTGPTWTYHYDTTAPSAAGTTKATDPESHSTSYKHNADGGVSEVTDALTHKRSTKFDANHNIDTATDAMGSGTTPGNETDCESAAMPLPLLQSPLPSGRRT
ncbi:hypothetical protein KUF83_38400 [Streptomyces sp. BV286]|nr:hypothetical protein [Streptomyces sp. BV286]